MFGGYLTNWIQSFSSFYCTTAREVSSKQAGGPCILSITAFLFLSNERTRNGWLIATSSRIHGAFPGPHSSAVSMGWIIWWKQTPPLEVGGGERWMLSVRLPYVCEPGGRNVPGVILWAPFPHHCGIFNRREDGEKRQRRQSGFQAFLVPAAERRFPDQVRSGPGVSVCLLRTHFAVSGSVTRWTQLFLVGFTAKLLHEEQVDCLREFSSLPNPYGWRWNNCRVIWASAR